MSLKILEFQTKDNQYILDGVTGSVFAVDDIIIECLKRYETSKSYDELYDQLKKEFSDQYKIKSALSFVKKYSEKGAFYVQLDKEKNKWTRGIRFHKKLVTDILKAGYTQQLVLNITEDCNMRCKYCYLSETYKHTRNRTSEFMSEETAIKSLDYFFELIRQISKFNPGKKCAITFYGGEALLNFPVIKKSIEYAKSNCPVTPMFNITTNGTLLCGEIADYLVKNEVAISVSLDGSREEHDRNRVDAMKNGTFDTIIRNIKALKRKYPDYHKINLTCVYDYNSDLEENDDFFAQEEELPLVGMVSPVVENGTDYYQQFSELQIDTFRKKYSAMLEKYISHKIHNEKMSSYLEMLLEMQLVGVLMKIRGGDQRLPVIPYTGTCIPGMKISVRPDGKFDMCEKINGTMPIGDIENGIDVEAVSEIIKSYNNIVTSDCYKCPINRQCGICFAQSCGNGKFEKPACDNIIASYKMCLSIAYTVLEQNPHAYDGFLYRDEWLLNT